jgi:hypothetical protein
MMNEEEGNSNQMKIDDSNIQQKKDDSIKKDALKIGKYQFFNAIVFSKNYCYSHQLIIFCVFLH